jgi:hypothetical protein
MIQRSIRSVRTLSPLALGASLLGCSADTVNMGEDGVHVEPPLQLPSHSRCRESTIIDGDVVAIRTQEGIAELEGCTTINGDLAISAFEGADLRPLHALTSVLGSLDLGGCCLHGEDPRPPEEVPQSMRFQICAR